MAMLAHWKRWLGRGLKGLGILLGLGLVWLFTFHRRAPEARLILKLFGCWATGLAPREISPASFRLDDSGHLWVADSMGLIRERSPQGQWRRVAGAITLGEERPAPRDGQGSSARFSNPTLAGFDGAGQALVLDLADARTVSLRRVARDGRVTTLWSLKGDARMLDLKSWHAGVRWPDGTLVFSKVIGAELVEVGPDGSMKTLLSGRGFQDGTPGQAKAGRTLAVACDGRGTVFFTDTVNRVVRRISPEGIISTLAGKAGEKGRIDGPAQVARFTAPYGIASNGFGDLIVTDAMGAFPRRVLADGSVKTLHLDLTDHARWAGDPGSSGRAGGMPLEAQLDGQGNILLVWTWGAGDGFPLYGAMLKPDGGIEMLFRPGPAGFVVPVDR